VADPMFFETPVETLLSDLYVDQRRSLRRAAGQRGVLRGDDQQRRRAGVAIRHHRVTG
jgi:hypothetical protein